MSSCLTIFNLLTWEVKLSCSVHSVNHVEMKSEGMLPKSNQFVYIDNISLCPVQKVAIQPALMLLKQS